MNRKRGRKGDAGQKRLGILESEVRAILRAGQAATITTTTATGENVERTTATETGHTKMIEDVVVAINDDVMSTVTMVLTDNGNAEGEIQVRTTRSGAVIIENESEKGPWSETIDLAAGGRVLQNGDALVALRVAKNGNVGPTTLEILIVTIDPAIGPPHVMVLRAARVERRQDASALQAQNDGASLRLAPIRTRRSIPLLKIAFLRQSSLQRRHHLFATLPRASLIPPLANRVLPTLQKTN